jgi:Animal haem peroxidase
VGAAVPAGDGRELNGQSYQRPPERHGVLEPRGLGASSRAPAGRGRFGRMFPNLPPYEPDDGLLERLAARMFDGLGGDHPDLPAGYTYFGQFVDHDLTFDPTSSLRRPEDPERLEDLRTPRLDLDAVYGSGPRDQPFLYDLEVEPRGALLLVGDSRAQFGPGFAAEDLPRNARQRALVGDPRNDENAVVAQLHLAFLKFHNRLAGALAAGAHAAGWSGAREELFEEARRIVRWHYQWLVAEDFLPKVVSPGPVRGLLGLDGETGGPEVRRFDPRRRWLDHGGVFVPVEFSAAAYRFGHSLVRPSYQLNGGAGALPVLLANPDLDPAAPTHLGGFRALPEGLVIDWARFFGPGAQPARAIDTHLSGPLARMPADPGPGTVPSRSLAWRNLVRGKLLGLPSGQAVARAMGATPLDDGALRLAGAAAPLWFYVLAEAETDGGGRHLGPVGATIVAEVLLGLLDADPESFLSVDPTWTPFLGTVPRAFTVADLVSYADGGHDPA